MATLDGLAVLGTAHQLIYQDDAQDPNATTYFGEDGLRSIGSAGFRGGTSTLNGLLGAGSANLLAVAWWVLRSQNNGRVHTLIEDDGTTWPNVVFREIRPTSRVYQGQDGTYWQSYTAEFLHLSR